MRTNRAISPRFAINIDVNECIGLELLVSLAKTDSFLLPREA